MRKLYRFLIVVLICPVQTGYAADGESLSLFNGLQLAQYSAGDDTSLELSGAERSYGPVRENEGLWEIARKFQPEGVTMSQLVMAIFHANPHAFYGNNINRLKINAVLKIPSDDEIRSASHRDAYSEVTEQITEYENYLAEKAKPKSDTDSAVATATVASATSVVEPEEIAEIKQELKIEEVQIQEKILAEPQPRPQQEKPRRPLFRYSYDLSVANDSNIRNAQKEFDIRDDIVGDLTVRARAGKSVGNLSLVAYGARASYQAFKTFDTLNNINFDINAKYRFAFSGGFGSPIYSIGAKLGGIESESDMRSSTLFSASLQVSKWFTNTINMTAGYEYRQRESASVVFDTVDNRLFVNIDLNLSKANLLYGTYTFITGDFVSSGTPDIYIINAADAIEPDDAFGGVATNQFAYRLDGDTNVITLGYNRIMSRKISLDFSYRYVDSEAKGGITYDRTIVRFSLLGRF
ncbi:MAG: hypothetical protein O7D36_04725 [Gammaproteobacteria bacterium]|nr:hypothetical protein [Gammaproteobacteria bacterium]